MHVVQIFLPLADNTGKRFPDAILQAIQQELIRQFGGLTAFSRAPAKGVWAHQGRQDKDDIVVVEVMTEALDRAWWREFRSRVERALQQEHLLVRAQAIEML